MEPSGCNRWQPVANVNAPETAQTTENRCRDGKEGVDGSSLSEGFTEVLHTGRVCLLSGRPIGRSTSTKHPPCAATISQ
jgi:hypothetical protein